MGQTCCVQAREPAPATVKDSSRAGPKAQSSSRGGSCRNPPDRETKAGQARQDRRSLSLGSPHARLPGGTLGQDEHAPGGRGNSKGEKKSSAAGSKGGLALGLDSKVPGIVAQGPAGPVPASPSWAPKGKGVALCLAPSHGISSSSSSRASSMCRSELAGAASASCDVPSPGFVGSGNAAAAAAGFSPGCSVGRSPSLRGSRRMSRKVSSDAGGPCAGSPCSCIPPCAIVQGAASTLGGGGEAPPMPNAQHPGTFLLGGYGGGSGSWKGAGKGPAVPRSITPAAAGKQPVSPSEWGILSSRSFSAKGALGQDSRISSADRDSRSPAKRTLEASRSQKKGGSGLGLFLWPRQQGQQEGSLSRSGSSSNRNRGPRDQGSTGAETLRKSESAPGQSLAGSFRQYSRSFKKGDSGKSPLLGKSQSSHEKTALAKSKSKSKTKGKGKGKGKSRGLSTKKQEGRRASGLGDDAGIDWSEEFGFLGGRAFEPLLQDGTEMSNRESEARSGVLCDGCHTAMESGRPLDASRSREGASGGSPDMVMVSSVLACGHVFHADCLDALLNCVDYNDPPCPRCSGLARKGKQPVGRGIFNVRTRFDTWA